MGERAAFTIATRAALTPPIPGPYVASLGMRFYRGGIFIAEHGSWNCTASSGYRFMFVSVQDNPPQSGEVFVEGWLRDGLAAGRPVDLLVMPDGSLLVPGRV